MFYSEKHKQYVNVGQPFTMDGCQYPANWLNLASDDDKAAIGLVEVKVIGQRGDDRYYWVEEQLDGATLTYVNTPKDLAGLKKQAVDQINATAYALLVPSDWMVVRAAEGGTALPDAWKQYRADVRTTANAGRAAIEAAADVESLIAASQINWPHDPDYVAPAAV